MIKSKNLPNTQHLTQEAQQRASAVARRRRRPSTPTTTSFFYHIFLTLSMPSCFLPYNKIPHRNQHHIQKN